MTDCPHLARTAMYFDGALPPAEEAAVIDHLATCEACQAVIGDAVSVEAAFSEAPVGRRARRRWPIALAATAALAAAATAVVVVRGPDDKPAQVALVLPAERALDARFSSTAFAAYRPLAVLRGDRATETIPLDTLAALERRGDPATLVAALAATGNLARAREIAERATLGEADRAALALVGKDYDAALVHATRALDRGDVIARWNFALAAHELGLHRVARDAFAEITEPGWRDEAGVRRKTVEAALAIELGFADFDRRGREMVAGGPLITLDEIARYPAFARVYVLDALRVNDPEPLRPLATALGPEVVAALERAKAVAPAIRAKLAPAYRAVVARTASADDIAALITAAKAARANDLLVGAIITSGRATQDLVLLTQTVAPWHDPWFDIAVTRTTIRAKLGPVLADPNAVPPLEAIYRTCPPAVSLRCGQVAQDIADIWFAADRIEAAESWAQRALADYRRAASPEHIANVRGLLANLHRGLGRDELARAELAELMGSTAPCALVRLARIAMADLALTAGRWDAAREALPPATPAAGCAHGDELQPVMTAADLARHTRDAGDRALAEQWIAAGRTSSDPVATAIAEVARLRIGADPAPAHAWLAAHPYGGDPRVENVRAWAFATLVSDAGARGDWAGAIAAAKQERPLGDAPCVVVASADDDVFTFAIATPDGTSGLQRRVEPREMGKTLLEPTLVGRLAACTGIAVSARPPLHGRADLLPPNLPWWFAGGAVPRTTVTPARAVEVTSPIGSDLPQLPVPPPSTLTFAQTLTGRDATPTRVLALLADATYAELHVHGVATARGGAAAHLVLSPDPDGESTLRADKLATAKFTKAPLVVLAACRAGAVTSSLRERWSLADAFLVAGASGVVAVDVPIPDAEARPIFDDLHRRVDAGEPVERALAAIRGTPGVAPWVTRLMLFR